MGKKKTRGRRGGGRGRGGGGFTGLTNSPRRTVPRIPRAIGWRGSFQQIMPPIFTTMLRFEKHVNFTQVGILSTSVRYVPTNAFDIDPTIGSTAMPGFTELGALYRNYRVLSYRVQCQFVNREAFPVTCYLHTVAFVDPGGNVGAAVAQTFLSNLHSKRCTLSGTTAGKPVGAIRQREDVANYTGEAYVGNTDPLCASVGGSPVNNLYLVVGAVPTDNAVAFTVAGVSHTISIDVEIAFYALQNPST